MLEGSVQENVEAAPVALSHEVRRGRGANGAGRGNWRRRLRRAGMVTAIGGVALSLTAAAANADSWSPYIAPQSYPAADCHGLVGPVLDPAGTNGYYAVIGGNYVYGCRTPHSIQIWTKEMYSPTLYGTYRQVGTTGYSSTYGYSSYLAETGKICGTGYWKTDAYASISGWGNSGWYESSPHYAVASKCR